ncbi:MAG: glycosyltransferase family 2 protein [Patescibacteria group bacterium]|jgi:glycosyltransferase involved in cell wall biosynthesis|nr:glycosyltransferase family 2 protein [Patescibacteria group bacterium]
MNLSIIIPALNEEKNIEATVDNVLNAFKELQIAGEIVIVNDGSTDKTGLLIEKKIFQFPKIIKMIFHQFPQGVGVSFWDGVENATGDIVAMIPGDNENNPQEILRYYWLMDHVDFVAPFIFNKEVRPVFRRFLSSLYHFIIRISFSINLNYVNGTILARKSVLNSISHRSKGFFFQTECLVKLIKRGYLFAEVPSKLNIRREGFSKALKFKSFLKVLGDYFNLLFDVYIEERIKPKRIIKESITYQRRYKENVL